MVSTCASGWVVLVVGLLPAGDDLDDLRRKLHHEDDDVRVEAVKALGKMDSLEATRLLVDALLDENPYVRDWTWTTLTKIRDPAGIDFLRTEGMGRPEVRIRLDLAEWAGAGKVEAAAPALRRLLQDRSPRVRIAAARSLAEIGDEAAIPDLEDRLREKKAHLRAEFLLALGRLAGEGAAGRVRGALSDRSWEMRVAALGLANRCLPEEEAVGAGVEAMKDRAWPVRAAAIALFADAKDGRGVGPLIDALEEEGRLRHDAHGALRRLTGEDIPLDADLWRKWWDVNREAYRPPAKARARDDPARKTRTRVLYHGVPVVSTRIAFVLDLSGSMREPVAGGGGRSKLEVAREELTRVIREIPRKAVFNCYFYNEKVTPWKERAAPATGRNRADAVAFVQRQAARGYTNLFGALMAALDDLDVDTIYLLSDGGPSRGEVIFRERIVHRVGERNRIRRVVIHTVDTGSRKWHQTTLLQDLSKGSGGTYVRLKGE